MLRYPITNSLDRGLEELTSAFEEPQPEQVFETPRWYFEQKLWVRDPLSAGNIAHNFSVPLRIQAPVDAKVLERSLEEVIRRHCVLRSSFHTRDGKLEQAVIPPQPFSLSTIDLSAREEGERDETARSLLLQHSRSPFLLSKAPLLRVHLIKLGKEDYILSLTTHHVVCDDWSLNILVRELFVIYNAYMAGMPSPLPELDFQYPDFVHWLEPKLHGSELSSYIAFWKTSLGDGNHYHHVSTDHPRSRTRSYLGKHETMIFSADLLTVLRSIAKQERVTLFMLLMAGLHCLLWKYSGDQEIGVGTCVANRPLLKLERLVGPFANVSVLRTILSPDLSFRAALQQVKQACLVSHSYQDLPFGILVETFQPHPDPGRNPLFQVLFVLLDAPAFSVPGLKVERLELDTGTSRYELNFWVRLAEQPEVDLQYSSDLFESSTVRKLLGDYMTVLGALTENMEAPLSSLNVAPNSKANSVESHPQPVEVQRGPSAIEAELIEMWEDELRCRPIGVNDDFFALGGDSLHAARLFAKIATRYQKVLALGALIKAPTVAKLAEELSASERQSGSACLVALQEGNSRLPLFCVHGQSGSILMYRPLAHRLGSNQTVYGIQPIGVGRKECLLSRIEDMAAAYVSEIQRVQPEGPYMLAGYCMGGTVAFEMACQLRRSGHDIGLLALLDTYNWIKMTPVSALQMPLLKLQEWWFSWNHFLLMPSEKKIEALARRARGKAPDPLSECNRTASLRYAPQIYDGRMSHFYTTHKYQRYAHPAMGWHGLTTAGVDEFPLRGYPGQLFEEPMVTELAVRLKSCINSVVQQLHS